MFTRGLEESGKYRHDQGQLAELLGVSKGTVAMWEIGKRGRTLKRLMRTQIYLIEGWNISVGIPITPLRRC